MSDDALPSTACITTPPAPLLFRSIHGADHHNESPSMSKATPISSVWLALLTYWTAARVAAAHLVSFETLAVSLTSAGAVVLFSLYEPQGDEPLVGALSLGFMSTIIVFPITANIGYAFTRRERALETIAAIKTYVIHIYVANRDWAFESKACAYSARNRINVILPTDKQKEAEEEETWQADGGTVARQHVHEVRFIIVNLIRAMRDYLTLPLVSRSRHLYTASGRQARALVLPVQQACLQDVYEQMQRLTLAVERLKEAGLPGNEAARINQYHSLLMNQWETARFIKSYRTPTGLRAFARLFILIYPFFAGPYYAWVAGAGKQNDDNLNANNWPYQTNLAFAIALAVFTGVALQGLFNVEVGLEDPFDETEGLDSVRLWYSFREIERLLSMEWSPGVWNETVMHGRSLVDASFSQDLAEIPKDVPRDGLHEAREAIKKCSRPLGFRS